MLFLVDAQGIPLCISKPIAGNHHDLYEINNHFKFMCQILEQAHIETHGMVMNADAGFDSMSFRDFCDDLDMIANIDVNKRNSKNADYECFIDPELYEKRFCVERTNAWIDGFKSLYVRYETSARKLVELTFLGLFSHFVEESPFSNKSFLDNFIIKVTILAICLMVFI